MVLKVSGQSACWSLPCTVCWKCDKGNSLQSWQSCPLDTFGVSRYSPSCSWTLPDWSCTFLGFPFPLGYSVPGFWAQLMTDWSSQWPCVGGEVRCTCQEFGGGIGHPGWSPARGNLRVPGGPLGEGDVFLCHDCHLVVTSVTLSPPKATLSPRLCWEGVRRKSQLQVTLAVPWVELLCSLLHVKWLYPRSEMPYQI